MSLYYNEANSYLLVNGKEIQNFKAKDSEIEANISNDWSVGNTKKTGLNRYVYDFRVDFSDTAVDDISDIQKNLMKKNDIV